MPPVAITQRQAVPLLIIVLSAVQQPADGVVPLLLLFAKKLKHGVKLVNIVDVQGEVGNWALIGRAAKTTQERNITRNKTEL